MTPEQYAIAETIGLNLFFLGIFVFIGLAIQDVLKKGDVIEISEPEGFFILEPKADKNYIGFAAGSGITPILSMIKVVLETETSSTFTLVYGNKNDKSVIFKSELEHLATTYPNNFKLHTIFSRAQVKNALRGRIDQNVTNYFVKNMYKETSFDAAFLCGPEEMIEEVSKTLQANKIPKENPTFTAYIGSEVRISNLLPWGLSPFVFFDINWFTDLKHKQYFLIEIVDSFILFLKKIIFVIGVI